MTTGVKIAALGYADDVVLIADSREKMQTLLDFCGRYSRACSFKFSPSKCEVILYHRPYRCRFDQSRCRCAEPLYLDGAKLKYVCNKIYLGVVFEKRFLTYKMYLDQILSRAVERSAGLRNLRSDGLGMRPATNLKLFRTLVRPIFEYGTQVIKPTKEFLNGAESCQCQAINTIF